MNKSLRWALWGLAVASLATLAVLYGPMAWDFLSDRQRVERVVEDAGAWGPVVFILIQALQIVVAPLPGQFTGFAAGYLFGTVLGSLYSLIGSIIGFTIVFYVARWLGRPALERFLDSKKLAKFDYLVETKGLFVFFFMFLLPFFPDDLLCYVAGLTKIPIKSLLLVAALGRLPGILVFAFAGEEIAANNYWSVGILGAVTTIVAGLIWLKRDSFEAWAQRLSKPTENLKH